MASCPEYTVRIFRCHCLNISLSLSGTARRCLCGTTPSPMTHSQPRIHAQLDERPLTSTRIWPTCWTAPVPSHPPLFNGYSLRSTSATFGRRFEAVGASSGDFAAVLVLASGAGSGTFTAAWALAVLSASGLPTGTQGFVGLQPIVGLIQLDPSFNELITWLPEHIDLCHGQYIWQQFPPGVQVNIQMVCPIQLRHLH